MQTLGLLARFSPLKSLVLFLSFLCLSAIDIAEAVADSAGQLNLDIFAEYWDAKDADSSAWAPGVGLSLPLLGSTLKLDTRLTYFSAVDGSNLGDLDLFPLDAGISFHILNGEGSNFDLYGMAGATYTFTKTNSKIKGVGSVNDSLGAYLGIGAAFMFSEQIGVFSNLIYRLAEFETDESDLFPKGLADFDADGLNLDVGLRFSF